MPLTPRMDAILTTSGSQVQLYKDLKNSGLSAWDAINYMVRNHPYGEGLSRDTRDIVIEQEQ